MRGRRDSRTARPLLLAAAAAGVLGLAAAFRLAGIHGAPPEMTSDHVEKLLDVLRIEAGARPLFLPGNGGREPLHFYLLVLLRSVTGWPPGFALLKAASVLEGLVSVVLSALLARELARGADPKRAGATAAALAAGVVVAVGHWPVLLSRLGLRLELTPLFAAAAAIPLVRGLRTGSRPAFAAAGLLVGAALYGYQASRALPLLLVLAVLSSLPILRSGEERRVRLAGLLLALLLATAVALPLAGWAAAHPAEFWGRASGRILGVDGAGGPAGAAPAFPAYARALAARAPVLLSNVGRTLGMLHVATDRSWFTGIPSGAPALDPLTGLLLLGGLAAFLRPALARGDPAAFVPLLGLVVGLLPSALAVSRPAEVPHAARSSGAIPFAAAAAGYGAAAALSLVGREAERRRLPAAVLVSVVGGAGLAFSAAWNADAYFRGAMTAYRGASQPHRAAGREVAAFLGSGGAPGSAFVLPWPHWVDHRAVLLEAGRSSFDVVLAAPGDAALAELAARRRAAGEPFDPSRPSLFLLHPDDAVGRVWLAARFPGGRFEDLSSKVGKPLAVFRVPATP